MSWPLLDATPVVSIRLRNPALDRDYPTTGETYAVVDTGYEGFLMLPWRIFQATGFSELRPIHTVLLAADGRRIAARAAYGAIDFPDIGRKTSGLIQSSEHVEESLLGANALEGLVFELDTCLNESRIRVC